MCQCGGLEAASHLVCCDIPWRCLLIQAHSSATHKSKRDTQNWWSNLEIHKVIFKQSNERLYNRFNTNRCFWQIHSCTVVFKFERLGHSVVCVRKSEGASSVCVPDYHVFARQLQALARSLKSLSTHLQAECKRRGKGLSLPKEHKKSHLYRAKLKPTESISPSCSEDCLCEFFPALSTHSHRPIQDNSLTSLRLKQPQWNFKRLKKNLPTPIPIYRPQTQHTLFVQRELQNLWTHGRSV